MKKYVLFLGVLLFNGKLFSQISSSSPGQDSAYDCATESIDSALAWKSCKVSLTLSNYTQKTVYIIPSRINKISNLHYLYLVTSTSEIVLPENLSMLRSLEFLTLKGKIGEKSMNNTLLNSPSLKNIGIYPRNMISKLPTSLYHLNRRIEFLTIGLNYQKASSNQLFNDCIKLISKKKFSNISLYGFHFSKKKNLVLLKLAAQKNIELDIK